MKDWEKRLADSGLDLAAVRRELAAFQVETPSWGYANTGTRFGKFLQPAAAATLEHKIQDAAEVHRLTGIAPAMADAIHDATGVWLKQLPFTPERVWRALRTRQ